MDDDIKHDPNPGPLCDLRHECVWQEGEIERLRAENASLVARTERLLDEIDDLKTFIRYSAENSLRLLAAATPKEAES